MVLYGRSNYNNYRGCIYLNNYYIHRDQGGLDDVADEGERSFLDSGKTRKDRNEMFDTKNE